jgi:D-alanyl-D-alanine dipeptidase
MFIILMGVMMSSAYAVPPNITLIADPMILKIPIRDNHEELVDLTKQKEIIYGPSPEIKNNTNYTFLRKTVYEKLKEANTQLPKGVYFCLYEGYRSFSLQKMLFEEQYQHVKLRHSDWPLTDIFNETTKLVSPVINQDGSKNIPPHATGAAIDVYLIDDNGKPLDMGIHPKDWMKDKEGRLSLTDSKNISKEAKTNRKIMSRVLTNVGFVNYPTEYWHWSYGDKYWAFVKKQPFALYGIISNEKK